eukprot:TRINITY_DN12845_c0_g1_i2.p1 TRINITY_DN12845_c0_g1~~TRINITY_DN12845_c0_g1_i2.p1  ORF type:complete len:329 (-),score=54.52 TRINITY_DN12845_c0_g1_i2:60-1046(-)
MEEEEMEVDQPKQKVPIAINKARLDQVIANLRENRSVHALTVFVRIFRVALYEAASKDTSKPKGKRGTDMEREDDQLLYVEEGVIFHQLLTFALEELPLILKQILNIQEGTPIKELKNRRLEILLKVLFNHLLAFLQDVHDDTTLLYIFRHLPGYVEALFALKVYLRKYFLFVLERWTSSPNMRVKLRAFLFVRKIAQISDTSFLEAVIKRTYVTMVKSAREMSWRAFEGLIFMINGFVELLSIDIDTSYYLAFGFLRQLAMHTKAVLKQKTKETIHKVYNWQVLTSLRVWLKAVATYPKEEQLGGLLYPLVEVANTLLHLYLSLIHI